MNDTVWASLISAASGILGAIVGGYFTVRGAIKAVERSSQDLESAEIRRQKVECLVSMAGIRFVIGGVVAPDEYKSKLMYEMNKIPVLWAEDSEVMKNLRDFHAEKNTEKMNERFILLLRNLARITKVSTELLSDADLKTVTLIPLNRR